MRKYLIFSTIILLYALLGCRSTGGGVDHIYIISTNDMHASIDAMPRLATLVAEYEERGEVVVVDSGDRVSGNAYVDDSLEPGVPMIELMNDVGYDVVTLGNHEFDRGSEALRGMVEAADFEVVCANVVTKDGTIAIEPYTIISVAGLDIGFVGVVDTSNDGYPLGGKSSYQNFSFTSDVAAAYEACEDIASECDFVVLLSHMGLESDELLAKRSPACHWIAGGHSHDRVNREVNGVRITQNNKNIRYATVADIAVCDGEILGVEYTMVDMSDVAVDSATMERVEALKNSDPGLNVVEGVALAAATKEGVANFTIASLAEYPYEDGFIPEVSFYHYGGIRLDGFAEGDIKRAEVLNNDPFHSTIYVGVLTPNQMRDFIIAKYNSGDAERPDKESHYPYFRSDAPYTILLGDEPIEAPDAVDIIFELEEREYRVAMCNYIADNYIDSAIVARQLRPTGVAVREAMLHHLRSFGTEGFVPNNECRQREIHK